MSSRAPTSQISWSPRPWRADLSLSPAGVAVALSVALHVAAAGWALTLKPHTVKPQPARAVAVRTVHQDVVLPRPPVPKLAVKPPPQPQPVVPKPALQVAAAPKPTAKPPPKRRKRRNKRKPVAKPKPTQFEPATPSPKPAPAVAPKVAPKVAPLAAAIPTKVAASGPGVAVVTSDPSGDAQADGAETGAVDPRAGHVDGQEGGTGFDLSGYGARVRAAVQRRQHYPEIAEEDGLEGTVRVRVVVRPNGQLAKPPKVIRSSGHRALDREALRMVRASAPFANLPSGFISGTAELTIPIVFELEDDDF